MLIYISQEKDRVPMLPALKHMMEIFLRIRGPILWRAGGPCSKLHWLRTVFLQEETLVLITEDRLDSEDFTNLLIDVSEAVKPLNVEHTMLITHPSGLVEIWKAEPSDYFNLTTHMGYSEIFQALTTQQAKT